MKKYKYVISVGCSFSATDATNLPLPGETYGDVVAKYFGAKHYNLSRSGGSLLRMSRKIYEWSGKNKDKFKDTLIIVGMTGTGRSEIWSNGMDYWYPHPGYFQEDVFKPSLYKIDWPLKERKKWFINFFNEKAEFIYATNIIIGLQSFFKVNTIDNIFFDALNPIDEHWEEHCDDKEDKLGYKLLFDSLVSQENWYKHPEYKSMIDFTEKNSDMRMSEEDFHPNKKAHKYWGECLLEFINEKV